MKHNICPLYEGSVILSGYPTNDVVKTTSPVMGRVTGAPNEVPLNVWPVLNVSVAGNMGGSSLGLVEGGAMDDRLSGVSVANFLNVFADALAWHDI